MCVQAADAERTASAAAKLAEELKRQQESATEALLEQQAAAAQLQEELASARAEQERAQEQLAAAEKKASATLPLPPSCRQLKVIVGSVCAAADMAATEAVCNAVGLLHSLIPTEWCRAGG